jgi:hypothetical protein
MGYGRWERVEAMKSWRCGFNEYVILRDIRMADEKCKGLAKLVRKLHELVEDPADPDWMDNIPAQYLPKGWRTSRDDI